MGGGGDHYVFLLLVINQTNPSPIINIRHRCITAHVECNLKNLYHRGNFKKQVFLVSLLFNKSDGEGYLFKRGIILFYILAKRHGC